MYWILLLLFLFSIISYIIFNTLKTHNLESFTSTNNTPINPNQLLIKCEKTKEFELDNYTIFDNNNNQLWQTSGKWNLDEFTLQLTNGKTNIVITRKDNTYKYSFNNLAVITEYKKTAKSIGTIIVNNYEDELYYTIDNTIMRQENTPSLANIILQQQPQNKTTINYILIYNESDSKYMILYIISFIIFNQINKQLNYSHD
jgi:hypothetical protein